MISRGYLRKEPFLLFCFFLLSSCVSHLQEAKFSYSQGENFSRVYQTEKAVASYKRALQEAALEVKKHPSAQAYMVKGMAEMHLDLWKEAEESFLESFSLGFEKGEEWAAQLSLFGLASSLQELGLEDSAYEIYAHLIERSKLKPISVLAAQRYTNFALGKALEKTGNEKKKSLAELLSLTERLIARDLSCGYYHYLRSQVLGHLTDYKKGFEQAVMAKELGLPTEEISRDNDVQIIFCYQNMKEKSSSVEREKFLYMYLEWVKKWRWQGPETPDWKKR